MIKSSMGVLMISMPDSLVKCAEWSQNRLLENVQSAVPLLNRTLRRNNSHSGGVEAVLHHLPGSPG